MDWRNASDYPEDNVSISRFAWEFLRRNVEYQKDYARVWGDLSKSEREIAFLYDPPRKTSESKVDYVKRIAGADYSWCRPLRWLERKWGFITSVPDESLVDGPAPSHPNPLDDEEIQLAFRSELSPPMIDGGFAGHERGILNSVRNSSIYGGPTIEQRIQDVEDAVDSERCAVEFDLSKALPPQLERAKKALQEWQRDKPKGSRAHRAKYPSYLRVLDGLDAGAADADIRATVYPKSKYSYDEARKAFDRAKKTGLALVDGGYRQIPISE